MSYSPTVRRLVAEAPNRGRLEDAVCARAENPICPDTVELYLRIQDGVIRAVRFQAAGCPAAIAAGAAVTEIVDGRSCESASGLSVEQLIDYLGGLPDHKRHGAEMAVRALKEALAAAGSRSE